MRRIGLLIGVCLIGLVALWPNLAEAWEGERLARGYYYALVEGEGAAGAAGKLQSTHPRAKVWQAREALKEGESQKAIGLVEGLAGEGDRDGLRIMGEALFLEGRIREALDAWYRAQDERSLVNAAAQLRANGEQGFERLAWELLYQLDPEKFTTNLAAFLRDRVGDYTTAAEVWEEALATYPRSRLRASWYTQLGRTYRLDENWQAAVEVYGRMLEENPNDIEAYLGIAWVSYERGDGMTAALGYFHSAIAVDDDAGRGFYAVAEMFVRERDYAAADHYYQQALEREPENRGWQLRRGRVAMTAQNYLLAREIFEALIAANPDYDAAYFELARTYQLLERPEQALVAVGRFLELKEHPTEREQRIVDEILEWARIELDR